jgi:hypothetical protein
MTEPPPRGVTIYLLHIEPPARVGSHYLGAAYDDMFEARLRKHARARGALYTARAVNSGRQLTLVRTWPGRSWGFEKELKIAGNYRRHCPICSPILQNRHPPPYPRVAHASPAQSRTTFKSFHN